MLLFVLFSRLCFLLFLGLLCFFVLCVLVILSPAEFAQYTDLANLLFAANSAKMQTGARQ